MSDPFARLAEAWTITLPDELIVGTSSNPVGYIAPVFASERDAADQIATLREQSPDYYADARAEQVGDPWQFMRRVAGSGCAAIAGNDVGHFQFMTRVEDSGQPLPNVLRYAQGSGDVTPCLTVTGVRRLSHAELTHWERYDVIDGLSAHELREQPSPFHEWESGDPFWEIRAPHSVLLVPTVPLVGDWNSVEGAFPLFSTREYAEEYFATEIKRGNAQLFIRAAQDEDGDPSTELSIEPVDDLVARVQALSGISPAPLVVAINPRAPRYDAAYGVDDPSAYKAWIRQFDASKVGGWADLLADVDGFWLRTARGLWVVGDRNSVSYQGDVAFWNGRDTIRWSKGQSIQLIPLSRTFAVLPRLASLQDPAALSEADLEEWLAAHLDDSLSDSDYVWDWMGEEPSERLRWDGFVLRAFDSITGEAGTTYFGSVLDALRYLWQHETAVDQPTRVHGASGPGVAGKPGSANAAYEEERGEKFRRGLLNIGRRILRDGYRPTEAANVVALCNAVLSRMHVDFAGYTRDLLAAAATEADVLAARLGIDEEDLSRWQESLSFPVDPQGATRVRARIGDYNFELLKRSAQGFLSTALQDWHDRGYAPQLDYAPISMEVVKALELELGAVFKAYRATFTDAHATAPAGNKLEEALLQFLGGGKPPMLGTMQQLLHASRRSNSALEAHWRAWLSGLPNAAFLTGKELNKALYRVTNDYRNSGVHDSPISYTTCKACIDELVGIDGSGLIVRVAAWGTPDTE